MQSLRLKGSGNIHLVAGGAFAKGLEVARRAFYQYKKSTIEAERLGRLALIEDYGDEEMDPARSGDKSLEGMLRGFEAYMLEYPLGQDTIVPYIAPNGEAAVEFSFAVPIPGTKHPETGNPLLYAGRFDMLGVFNNQLYVVDEKTTSSLGDKWARQWDLDSQFTGYCWAARQYGYHVNGAIIRGVGLLKTKTTHAEAIISRAPWTVDRWLEQLQWDIQDMIAMWKANRYKLALDKSMCDAYSGCPYKVLCESPEPERWRKTHFKVSVWNPLSKE